MACYGPLYKVGKRDTSYPNEIAVLEGPHEVQQLSAQERAQTPEQTLLAVVNGLALQEGEDLGRARAPGYTKGEASPCII